MGKTAIWRILCFYPLPPLNNVEKQGAKLASSYFLNTLFKIPIIFCHGSSEISKKKKDEVLRMPFQITQICLNESDYVTLHSVMNIMTENGPKMTHIMLQ